MSRPDTNCSVMLSLVDLFVTRRFKRKFNTLELTLKDFLMWARKAAVPATKDIISKMEENVSRRKSELKEFHFLTNDNLELRGLGTEQVCRALRASLAIYTYALKHGWIREPFFYMLQIQDYPASLFNKVKFLQLVQDRSSREKA